MKDQFYFPNEVYDCSVSFLQGTIGKNTTYASTRMMNILQREADMTIGRLLEFSPLNLKGIKGLGLRSRDALYMVLKSASSNPGSVIHYVP